MRALLFVPGDRPERYAKALASGADAVIVDLEDAVAAADKDRARESLRQWLRSGAGGAQVMVRINAAGTPWFTHDLALAAVDGIAAVVLPKAEDLDAIAAITALRDGLRVLPLIESAAGIESVLAIARAPGVARLVFGSIDLQADLGMRDATEDDLLPFRLRLLTASRLAGLAPPVDGVTVAIDDEARLAGDTLRARRLGFGGKLCIHPKQVATVQRNFAPGAAEIDWARRVLEAIAQSAGSAVALDGKMVDTPVILRAQAILREAAAVDGRPTPALGAG